MLVLPLLQPPEVEFRPLEDGQVERLVVGVCCLEDWGRVGPQRFWPISVRVLELELEGMAQESLVPASLLDAGVARLQVEELSADPGPVSDPMPELAVPTVLSEAERGAVPMALEATLPGVMVGSSVGSFI